MVALVLIKTTEWMAMVEFQDFFCYKSTDWIRLLRVMMTKTMVVVVLVEFFVVGRGSFYKLHFYFYSPLLVILLLLCCCSLC